MRALLDTCVVSELQRKSCSPIVRAHVDAIQVEDLFLSVVTVGELSKGISLLRASRRKESLVRWLLQLEQGYANRILGVDSETAHIWGELAADAQKRGRTVSVMDGLIAATAIRNGLCVLTRNVSDFRETGARLANPWDK